MNQLCNWRFHLLKTWSVARLFSDRMGGKRQSYNTNTTNHNIPRKSKTHIWNSNQGGEYRVKLVAFFFAVDTEEHLSRKSPYTSLDHLNITNQYISDTHYSKHSSHKKTNVKHVTWTSHKVQLSQRETEACLLSTEWKKQTDNQALPPAPWVTSFTRETSSLSYEPRKNTMLSLIIFHGSEISFSGFEWTPQAGNWTECFNSTPCLSLSPSSSSCLLGLSFFSQVFTRSKKQPSHLPSFFFFSWFFFFLAFYLSLVSIPLLSCCSKIKDRLTWRRKVSDLLSNWTCPPTWAILLQDSNDISLSEAQLRLVGCPIVIQGLRLWLVA